MRPPAGVSFRVIHPEPFDFRRIYPLDPEITCVAQFPSWDPARKLKGQLSVSPSVRNLQIKKSPGAFEVYWTLPWKRALTLPLLLKNFTELKRQIKSGLKAYRSDDSWVLGGSGEREYKWARKTQVMGILNVTPDSFSDGGFFMDPSLAAERALQMQTEGADWIDVGGESTRPGARGISPSGEKKRILPVLRACAKLLRVPLSVDTYKSEVARAAVGEGAQMINDIGALGMDREMGKTLARLKVPVILMHMRGKPGTMQKNPVYRDVVGDLTVFFRERIAYALGCGILENRILIDPGFGFGKTPWHNLELTRRLWEFKILGRPIVMGVSRKSTLGFLLGGAPSGERNEATGAAVAASVLKGADWVRVHDVKAAVRVVKIADAIRYDRGLTKP